MYVEGGGLEGGGGQVGWGGLEGGEEGGGARINRLKWPELWKNYLIIILLFLPGLRQFSLDLSIFIYYI